jgi:hypothetical protein
VGSEVERVEGWEWVLIQSTACTQCGDDPAALDRTALGPAAVASVDAWDRFLSAADDGYLRTYPDQSVWSPIEYAAHVRDMLREFGSRIEVALTQDNPSVAGFDHEPAATAGRYNELPVEIVAGDLRAQAVRLGRILETVDEAGWARTAMRDGVDRFTVHGMACFAVHESHHHLLDAAGTL